MKIEFSFINRDFNRKTSDPLLQMEYEQLKTNPTLVFQIIEEKKLSIKEILQSVRNLYLNGLLLYVYLGVCTGVVLFSILLSSIYAAGGSLIILFLISLRLILAFQHSYNSEKDRQYYERYYYELHNEIVKISSNYEDYLSKYEEQKLEGKLAWRPNI